MADWVWFTDCDIVFHRDCLDTLARELQGRRDLLAYPKFERITPMLAETDPVLAAERDRPRVVDIDTSQFTLAANPAEGQGRVPHRARRRGPPMRLLRADTGVPAAGAALGKDL